MLHGSIYSSNNSNVVNVTEKLFIINIYACNKVKKDICCNNGQKTLCNALQKKITLCFIINISNTYKPGTDLNPYIGLEPRSKY